MKRYKKYIVLATILMAVVKQGQAQTVPVGMPFFEEALRRAQLMGKLDSNVSFNIRPVDAVKALHISQPFGKDSLLFPTDNTNYFKWANLHFLKNQVQISLLPVYTHTQYNQHHPYGWNDGIRIPNKGFQQYVSAGVYLKAGPLEVQFRPEMVTADNKDFQNPPYRTTQIDNPDRMGTLPYRYQGMGQSFVKLNLGPMTVGYSNENVWWGPGYQNAIILSNNAPGFKHFTINTNKPIVSRYGSFEMQILGGKLESSGFWPYATSDNSGNWPPIAADIVAKPNDPTYHSYFTGMIASFQPKVLPGLFLGITRIVQLSGEPKGFGDYFKSLYVDAKNEQTGSGVSAGGVNRNQIISFFGRYLFQKSNAELYFEVGREDWWWDWEDLITDPTYSSAWLAGFKKVYILPGKDRWLEINTEMTNIQAPMANLPRSYGYSFYKASGDNPHGWTNKGQVLGAGIGPGSNIVNFGFNYGKGFETYGVHFEKVMYNEDMFYTQIKYLQLSESNPLKLDFSKHYVDYGILLNHQAQYGKFIVGYNFHILRTYNFQWNYDPFGAAGPFRFPGLNAWSFNAQVYTILRF